MKKDKRHIRWLYGQTPHLREAGILDAETELALKRYYGEATRPELASVAFRAFAILGALLLGLGIVLLFGYNWDSIPRVGKTVLAFVPLTVASGLVGYTLRWRSDSVGWRESASLGFALASAACIGLIGQAWQIDGELREFYRTWIWLSLPLLALFRSWSIYFLLLAVTALWMPMAARGYTTVDLLTFIAVAGLTARELACAQKKEPSRVSLMAFAISMTIGLGFVFGESAPELWPSWLAILLCVHLLLDMELAERHSDAGSKWVAGVAKAGLLLLYLIVSFDDAWALIGGRRSIDGGAPLAIAAGLGIGLLTIYAALLRGVWRRSDRSEIAWALGPVVAFAFNGFVWAFPEVREFAPWGITAYLAGLAIVLILAGYRGQSAAQLNQGLLVIVGVVAARFFDSDVSMLYRGIGFVGAGIGFLVSNYLLLKRKKGVGQ